MGGRADSPIVDKLNDMNWLGITTLDSNRCKALLMKLTCTAAVAAMTRRIG